MSSKIMSAAEAVADIPDGASIAAGGFGLSGIPQVVIEAGEKYEPSIVTRHIVSVAQAFNKFYHDEQILVDSEDEKLAKLALVISAGLTIKNGLALLGIQAPERM